MLRKIGRAFLNLAEYFVLGATATAGILTAYVLFVGVSASIRLYQFEHQQSISEEQTDVYYGEQSENKNPKYNGIIRLTDKDGDFFCTAFVVDANYAYTAAHCVVDYRTGGLSKKPIKIKDALDTDTGVVAHAAAMNERMDYAIVRGDFSNFKPLVADLDSSELFTTAGPWEACGFPMGQKKLACMPVKLARPYNFSIIGAGALYPGQSGGPVINLRTGHVVALNSAATENGMLFVPLIGSLASFGIEE